MTTPKSKSTILTSDTTFVIEHHSIIEDLGGLQNEVKKIERMDDYDGLNICVCPSQDHTQIKK